MIDLREFRKGMELLGTAFNRAITPELLDVFGGVLSQRLVPEQWARAVTRALEAERFFPPPAVLLRYGLAEGSAKARAAEMYEQILGCFERGQELGPRDVRERFGDAAMDGFVAAGGREAFAWCEMGNRPFRLKAFVEAWSEATQEEPAKALPAGESVGLLHG